MFLADLRLAHSEATLQNCGQTPKSQEVFTTQSSQDDSAVRYHGNQNGEELKLNKKSYSVDAPLKSLLSERYNCNALIKSFLLSRAETRSCNPADHIPQSGSLLPLVEVTPRDRNYIQSDDNSWKISLDPFRIPTSADSKHLSPKVRKYYKGQNKLIRSFEEAERLFGDCECDEHSVYQHDTWPRLLSILSLLINIVLLIIKSVAVYLSGSIAIISSLVDSAVDIVASLIIWWTSSAVIKRDPYVYPQGRTRLEPIAVIILSVLMSLAAIQLVVEALERIVYLKHGYVDPPNIEKATISICALAIVSKLLLFLFCRHISSRSVMVKALQLDHRNDVFSNTMAILCAYLGSRQAIAATGEVNVMYIDPLGAVFMSAYIMANWWRIGIEQIKRLTGHTATPQFLSKLTWICLNHHEKLAQVDTVRAFHFGNNFLVEVDIVLPGDMNIHESHDIGESLQHKLERLDDVERAFVHLDYETTHNPLTEHKVV